MLWHHEFKMLRQRLVEVYTQPAFDVDEVNGINERLKELVAEMNDSVTMNLENNLRGCYDHNVSITETMKKCNTNRNTVLNFFHKFHVADMNRVPTFGDPGPGRSALDNYTPWVPSFNDKPITAVSNTEKSRNQQSDLIIKEVTTRKSYGGELPADDEIQTAVELACGLTGGDYHRVFKAYQSKEVPFFHRERDSRARRLAMLALYQLYPDASRAALARKLGVPDGSASVYFKSITSCLKNANNTWIQPSNVEEVMAAVVKVRDAEKPPAEPVDSGLTSQEP